MSEFRKHLWLWGQTAGTHTIFPENVYKLPAVSRMTPVEGAVYFGIPNMCRVVMADKPKKPWDQEAIPLDRMDKVVWSVLGSGGSLSFADGSSDLDEVIKLAKRYDNVVGGVLDDFFSPSRMDLFPPQKIKGYSDALHTAAGRKLDLWAVLYEHELSDAIIPYLDYVDVLTFWTWYGENLKDQEKNIERVRNYIGKDKPLYAGVYMWDYGNCKPIPDDVMKTQLDTVYKLIMNKSIDGMILCSNCIADIGLSSVDITRKWIDLHGDENVPD